MNFKNLIKKILRIDSRTTTQKEIELLKARGLRIGKNVDIFSDYPFDSLYPGLITIGDYVTISSDVKILTHDASMGYVTNGMCKIGEVKIGNHVFIGRGTTILCNVNIGDYAVIGAGSVVTCDVPSGTVYAGNPARFIKTTDEFREQHLKACERHFTIGRSWKEIKMYKNEEWEQLHTQLNGTYGYIVRKKKDQL